MTLKVFFDESFKTKPVLVKPNSGRLIVGNVWLLSNEAHCSNFKGFKPLI